VVVIADRHPWVYGKRIHTVVTAAESVLDAGMIFMPQAGQAHDKNPR
jgi:hypothetical protein